MKRSPQPIYNNFPVQSKSITTNNKMPPKKAKKQISAQNRITKTATINNQIPF
jgi:hypothetical protein